MSARWGRDAHDRRRRVGDDHVHPDLWTEADHQRFEDRLHQDLKGIGTELKALGRIQGALALAAVAGPIIVVIALRILFPVAP